MCAPTSLAFFVGIVSTKPDRVKKHFWAILSGTKCNSWEWCCVGLGVGLDDPCGFFPTQLTLWFCVLFSPTHAICFPQPVLSNNKKQTAFSYSKYTLRVCLLRCQPSFWVILQNPLCCWHWLAVLSMSCSTECLLCISLPIFKGVSEGQLCSSTFLPTFLCFFDGCNKIPYSSKMPRPLIIWGRTVRGTIWINHWKLLLWETSQILENRLAPSRLLFPFPAVPTPSLFVCELCVSVITF